MGEKMSVDYSNKQSVIYNIRDVNSSFAHGSLRVMYLGNNRNKSHFSKESVNRALPTLFNVPIVCHWDENSGKIGGHDIDVTTNSDGQIIIKNLTEPCGMVPEHAKFRFETIEDEDGVEREYLIIEDILLWKRQNVFRHITDDLKGIVKHSMEIEVNKSNKTQDGYWDITDFEFTALCLLESCEPCFEGSQLELFSAKNFKHQMELMMSDLKESFTQINTFNKDDDKYPQNDSMKGGKTELEDKMKLIAEYNIDINSLDFSIEDFTVEELTEKFKAIKDNKKDDKFALTSNIVDELYRLLSEVKVEREWGECCRYWYVDCDFEANEVYCWDSNDGLLYGFSYTVNGDSISIDYACKKRKKYVIADFDEGDQGSPFEEMFTALEETSENLAKITSQHSEATGMIESMKSELDSLRQFKTNTEEKISMDKKNEIFEKFEDLSGIEAFEKLRESCGEYEVDAIEEKCYAIRGRNGMPKKFSLDCKTPKLKVDKKNTSNEPYGGIFAKYGFEN